MTLGHAAGTSPRSWLRLSPPFPSEGTARPMSFNDTGLKKDCRRTYNRVLDISPMGTPPGVALSTAAGSAALLLPVHPAPSTTKFPTPLPKRRLRLQQHKLSSNLGLWVRHGGISKDFLAQPYSF